MQRKALSLAIAWLSAFATSAHGLQVQVPEPAEDTRLQYELNATARMTLPVMIGDRGPFNFIVDTGSDRTVISNRLADDLGLLSGAAVTMHSTSEISRVSTFAIPRISFGRRILLDVEAPGLNGVHIGAEGMLGLDSLRGQRLHFDFRQRTITMRSSERTRWPSGTIVVRGRSRLGRLVLADASFNGQRVWVIVDTGAQATIGNSAFRQLLQARSVLPAGRPVTLVSVTGGLIQADFTTVKRLRIGGLTVENMPVAFADVHPFRQLDLLDRPAILLGMDALQLFHRISIDFARREMRFLPFEASSFVPLLTTPRPQRSSIASTSWKFRPES